MKECLADVLMMDISFNNSDGKYDYDGSDGRDGGSDVRDDGRYDGSDGRDDCDDARW